MHLVCQRQVNFQWPNQWYPVHHRILIVTHSIALFLNLQAIIVYRQDHMKLFDQCQFVFVVRLIIFVVAVGGDDYLNVYYLNVVLLLMHLVL